MNIDLKTYIDFALIENAGEALKEQIGEEVHHIVAPENDEAPFPYVLWGITNGEPNRTKDGIDSHTFTVSVEIVDRDTDNIGVVMGLVVEALEAAVDEWNDKEDKPYMVAYQNYTIGQESFDLTHDGPYVPITYTIEIY